MDQLQFPRMVSSKSDGCRLHVFCDASAKAYGAVAYLCHNKETSLLTSRCRLPPDKRKAFPYPRPPPLPTEWVQYVRPFECTGVDFTGAIKVQNRSGETQKLYVCLFTCVATRAVHLQLINSLSAEAFVLCLRRFVAKCSLPSKLLSDNGTNFVAVSKFLVEFCIPYPVFRIPDRHHYPRNGFNMFARLNVQVLISPEPLKYRTAQVKLKSCTYVFLLVLLHEQFIFS